MLQGGLAGNGQARLLFEIEPGAHGLPNFLSQLTHGGGAGLRAGPN